MRISSLTQLCRLKLFHFVLPFLSVDCHSYFVRGCSPVEKVSAQACIRVLAFQLRSFFLELMFVQVEDKDLSSSDCRHTVFVEETVFSLVCILAYLSKIKWLSCVSFSLGPLFHPTLHVPVFVPVPCCFCYCGSVVQLTAEDPPSTNLSAQDCFGYLGISCFHMNLKAHSPYFYEK